MSTACGPVCARCWLTLASGRTPGSPCRRHRHGYARCWALGRPRDLVRMCSFSWRVSTPNRFHPQASPKQLVAFCPLPSLFPPRARPPPRSRLRLDRILGLFSISHVAAWALTEHALCVTHSGLVVRSLIFKWSLWPCGNCCTHSAAVCSRLLVLAFSPPPGSRARGQCRVCVQP